MMTFALTFSLLGRESNFFHCSIEGILDSRESYEYGIVKIEFAVLFLNDHFIAAFKAQCPTNGYRNCYLTSIMTHRVLDFDH